MRREHWNRKYAEAESLWSTTPNRFLVAETSHLEPGRALDLACGEGRNARWLAARGWTVTGVDFSDVAIVRARELAAREHLAIEFVCADLLDYEPEPTDSISCSCSTSRSGRSSVASSSSVRPRPSERVGRSSSWVTI